MTEQKRLSVQCNRITTGSLIISITLFILASILFKLLLLVFKVLSGPALFVTHLQHLKTPVRQVASGYSQI